MTSTLELDSAAFKDNKIILKSVPYQKRDGVLLDHPSFGITITTVSKGVF